MHAPASRGGSPSFVAGRWGPFGHPCGRWLRTHFHTAVTCDVPGGGRYISSSWPCSGCGDGDIIQQSESPILRTRAQGSMSSRLVATPRLPAVVARLTQSCLMYGFLGWPMTDTKARFLLVDKLLHHCVVYDCTRGMGPVPIAGHVAPPRCPGDYCGYGARSARGCFPAGSASWVAPVSAFPGGACLLGLEGLVLPVQPESVLQEFFVGHLGLGLQVGTFDHV
jgi:hypothetical protein